MKKKLLYVAPDHYSFYKVLLKGLVEYTEYDVTFFRSNKDIPQYKYAGEKIINFITKNLFSYNTKKRRYSKEYIERIKNLDKYDLLFINRPDILNNEELVLLISKCKKTIVYYWDSFEKIKNQKKTFSFFDTKYSFDKNDSEAYKLQIGHNFYFYTEKTIEFEPKYDAFFLGTYDNRYPELLKILDILKRSDLQAHAKLYVPPNEKEIVIARSEISILEAIVPFNKAYIFNLNTRIIVDIQHRNQIGLSFRPYEAMGLGKKLITTNTHIKTHDFYNPNNVFVITKETTHIPDSFIKKPYQQISPELLKKYHLKGWINRFILNKQYHNE